MAICHFEQNGKVINLLALASNPNIIMKAGTYYENTINLLVGTLGLSFTEIVEENMIITIYTNDQSHVTTKFYLFLLIILLHYLSFLS